MAHPDGRGFRLDCSGRVEGRLRQGYRSLRDCDSRPAVCVARSAPRLRIGKEATVDYAWFRSSYDSSAQQSSWPPLDCRGGQGVVPYEQNTQQSPGTGRNNAAHASHS